MALLQQLVGFTLRQVIDVDVLGDVDVAAIGDVAGGVGGRVLKVVGNHFRDHGETLQRALTCANDNAWHALGVALGGSGVLNWLKRKFAGGDAQGVSRQIEEFLKHEAASLGAAAEPFRERCRAEYQRAARAGLFQLGAVAPADAARQAADFDRYANPASLIDGANRAITQVAAQLTEAYPNLAKLLCQPTGSGVPLLAAAFLFFFRRKVETDDELTNGLIFDSLRKLTAAQAKAFAEVGKALATLGPDIQSLMQQLDKIATDVKDIKEDTTEIKENTTEIKEATTEIKELLKNRKPGLSYENEEERAYLRQCRDEFRKLPRAQQTAADWSAMADRLDEAGLFDLAREDHEHAATVAQQENNQLLAAKEHEKAFRAACENEQWSAALASLVQAVELNPQLEPFDWEQYELLEILGAGGFGTVFKCRDRNVNQVVAIKAIHAGELARGIQEVFNEAALLTTLRHAAIITVQTGRYTAQRLPYIIMEYFPSQSLAARLKRGPLPVAEVLAVVRPVAEALRAAHRAQPQPIYHRDVKPDNVLVDAQGQVKVIDFGMAVRPQAARKSIARPRERRTLLDQSYAGTLKYAPPEQKGELLVAVGTYSDVYAFGRTCCELLFGVTDPKRRHWERKDDPIPPDLANLLERCIEHEVADRPQQFQEVLDVLDEVLAELASAKQQQREKEAEKQLRQEAERRQLELLQQKGKEALRQLVQTALTRTGGKLSTEDTTNATDLCRRHNLSADQGNAVVSEVRKVWLQQEREKQDRKKRDDDEQVATEKKRLAEVARLHEAKQLEACGKALEAGQQEQREEPQGRQKPATRAKEKSPSKAALRTKKTPLRVVLFGMPVAGKSSMLGALAQAAQTQEHTLNGHLIDQSQRLLELQRRLYEDRPRETLEEIAPYEVSLQPLDGKAGAAAPAAVSATLFDCDGRVANELLAQKDLVSNDRALTKAVLDADTLVLAVDATTETAVLNRDFGQFAKFLRVLERSRGQRAEVGGLPVYLVLTKCDLLAQKADTAVTWMQRIEERKQKVDRRFQEFLAQQAEREHQAFGKIELHLWATAVKRPALADTPARPRDPYGVAELFRFSLASAMAYRERRSLASRRLMAVGAILALVALTLFVALLVALLR